MPVKSRKGAEAAALSRAFKNYLANLEKYAKPEQVTEQFDKYLPFAIAFGLERTWINRFSRIPTTPMPGWYYPVGRPFIAYPGRGTGMASRGSGRAHSAGQPGVGVPSLQGMSGGLSGGLQSMSDGLNTMLNSAARTLTSTPPASNTSIRRPQLFGRRRWRLSRRWRQRRRRAWLPLKRATSHEHGSIGRCAAAAGWPGCVPAGRRCHPAAHWAWPGPAGGDPGPGDCRHRRATFGRHRRIYDRTRRPGSARPTWWRRSSAACWTW